MLLILRKVAEYFTSGHNFRFYTKTYTVGKQFSGNSQPYQFAHFRPLHKARRFYWPPLALLLQSLLFTLHLTLDILCCVYIRTVVQQHSHIFNQYTAVCIQVENGVESKLWNPFNIKYLAILLIILVNI